MISGIYNDTILLFPDISFDIRTEVVIHAEPTDKIVPSINGTLAKHTFIMDLDEDSYLVGNIWIEGARVPQQLNFSDLFKTVTYEDTSWGGSQGIQVSLDGYNIYGVAIRQDFQTLEECKENAVHQLAASFQEFGVAVIKR